MLQESANGVLSLAVLTRIFKESTRWRILLPDHYKEKPLTSDQRNRKGKDYAFHSADHWRPERDHTSQLFATALHPHRESRF
jgi:hypothetical protein